MMQLETLSDLLEAIDSDYRPKFVFFWGHTSKREGVGKECFSQWYPAKFTIDGIPYGTAEHWMMAEKARLFGDKEHESAILDAQHPGEAKNLGRQVRGFRQDIWENARFEIVVRGNQAKFDQNAELCQFLLQTGDRVLVEASPRDRIWGIGLSSSATGIEDPKTWKGLNLLGFALMRVRSLLQSKETNEE